jgi:hypothetical protein
MLEANLAALTVTLSRVSTSMLSAQATETQLMLVRMEQRLNQNNGILIFLAQAFHRCYSEFRTLLLFMFLGHMMLLNYIFSGPQLTSFAEETLIYIDDPNRRTLKFLCSTIHDWDDFETLLKMQFKREAGLRKISAGEYVLHDFVRCTDIFQSAALREGFDSRQKTLYEHCVPYNGCRQRMPKVLRLLESNYRL